MNDQDIELKRILLQASCCKVSGVTLIAQNILLDDANKNNTVVIACLRKKKNFYPYAYNNRSDSSAGLFAVT
jgi:hypothetical protein